MCKICGNMEKVWGNYLWKKYQEASVLGGGAVLGRSICKMNIRRVGGWRKYLRMESTWAKYKGIVCIFVANRCGEFIVAFLTTVANDINIQ